MRKTNCMVLFLFLFSIFIVPSLSAQRATPPVLDEDILKKIQDEVSGSICFEHIRYLSTLHRQFGSRDYHQAAEYVVRKCNEYGLMQALIEKYPIKSEKQGFRKYIISDRPLWECQKGELRLVKPYSMLISHYESAPTTVAQGSRSTNTTAEIVFVGRGDSEEAYKGKEVKGKIVLCERGSHMKAHELAVYHFGARGTILSSTWSEYPEEWDAIHGLPIWPYLDKSNEPTFGFNLSRNKGLFLKELLDKGEKVVISATIEAKVLKEGAYELPTAIIPGSTYPDKEFIFFAHLDHPKPGAHDNASGDAVLLEMARTLTSLIQKKIIPPPKKTIRFMWVPHMRGLYMYFFHHPEKIGKVKGGCNLDCVGVDQAKFPSKFHVALPLYSLPSLLTDITNNLVDYFNQKVMLARNPLYSPEGSRNLFSATLRPFRGASDEELVSTWPISIPSIYFYDSHLPPRHSQINFLEYIDRTNLRRVAYLGAIISYAFASVGEEVAPSLLNEILYRGKERLERELVKAKALIEESDRENVHQNFDKGKKFLFWGIKREERIAASLESLISKKKHLNLLYSEYKRLFQEDSRAFMDQLRKYYKLKCQSLNIKPLKRIPKARESSWEKMIPVYNPKMKGFPGCFRNYSYFIDILGKDFLEKYKGLSSAFWHRNKGLEMSFNLIDSKNTIADIHEAVQEELWSGDYPLSPYSSLSFELLTSYFQLLKDAHVIDFKK